MAVFQSKDGEELIVTCKCHCGAGVQLMIDPDDNDYCLVTYIGSKFYEEQWGAIRRFIEKCNRIWRIIRNKDYCYSDIIMTKQDFETFKEYVNKF